MAEPETDKGTISIRLSTGRSGIQTLEPILSAYEEIANDESVKAITSYFTAGSDNADIEIVLKDDPKKRKSSHEIVKSLKQKYDDRFMEFLPRYFLATSPLGDNANFSVTLKTNKSYDELEEVGGDVIQVLRRLREPYKTKNIQVSRTRPEKTLNLVPNRDRCYLAGARLEDVRNSIRYIMRGNPPADRYERDGKQYPIRVWVSEEDRQNPEIVKEFMIRSYHRSENRDDYDLVSLRDLIEVKESKIRQLMLHDFSQRAYNISCEFENKDTNLVKAYEEFERSAFKVLPPGYTMVPSADIRKLVEESNSILFIIALALIFVYLVMAALFESFVDPFIVMCTVPLAISWAIISLKVFPKGSLNAYSYIGILTLIGLITKHGILLVEVFNTKFKETKSPKTAAIESAMDRFRPIVMTTLAMVLGALPLIIKKGSGYEGPRQVGIVLVGGMTLVTIMTIFIVPCLCIIFKKLQQDLIKRK
jgi:multidrug efflux pump